MKNIGRLSREEINWGCKDLTSEDIERAREACRTMPDLRPLYFNRQSGPWVLDRYEDNLTKLITVFDSFAVDDPCLPMRGIFTGIREDSPMVWTDDNMHLHPDYAHYRSAAAAEMCLRRMEKIVDKTATIHHKEKESFGKLIWFGLKVLGVV